MPHRVGNLWEKTIDYDNCLQAVWVGTENLKRTAKVRKIRKHPKRYASLIQKTLIEGWTPSPCREKTINEGTGHKIRHLRIPTMLDHLIHTAIMLPLQPILCKRYDYYSCGSIPGKGQTFANKYMTSWLVTGIGTYEYGAEADVQKFYPSCKAHVVMSCLERIIKDSRYLDLHRLILSQMGGTIAIGFSPSHWYGNLVLTKVDNALRSQCGEVKFVRYMDNYALVAHNKKSLHHAIDVIKTTLAGLELQLNNSYQVFPLTSRALTLLSYRYFTDRVILRKPTMYNITKNMKTASKHGNAHLARGVMSRLGVLKHCNSYTYRKKYVDPIINVDFQRRMISDVDKKRKLHSTSE